MACLHSWSDLKYMCEAKQEQEKDSPILTNVFDKGKTFFAAPNNKFN